MRIISGMYRGKRLGIFEAKDIVRPTIDRVKESIFDKIQFNVRNAVVLDLFGGTGSLGLEALSRGARVVYIADSSEKSIEAINKNAETFKEKPTVLHMDYLKCLDLFIRTRTQFDLIFIDPPYSMDYGPKSIEIIEKNELLRAGGTIIYEHEGKEYEYSGTQYTAERRQYGRVDVTYLQL